MIPPLASRVILQPRMGKKLSYWGKRQDMAKVLDSVDRLKNAGAPVQVD